MSQRAIQSGGGNGDTREGFDPKQAGGRFDSKGRGVNQYAVFFGSHCNSGYSGDGCVEPLLPFGKTCL